MVRLTIAESVAEELVYIGMTQQLQGLAARIDDIDGSGDIDKKRFPAPAEKAAVKAEWGLEVSWAVTESRESAEIHKAALVEAHLDRHGHKPSFWNDPLGERIPGVQKVGKVKEPTGDLDWSGWKPMVEDTKGDIPKGPGVYRIWAVKPGV